MNFIVLMPTNSSTQADAEYVKGCTYEDTRDAWTELPKKSMLYTLSDLMDSHNNDEINLGEYWISHITILNHD